MLNPLLQWIDERTGLVAAARALLDRPVPGGARWRHSLGFALVATLAVEFATGVLLMLAYSPSTATAWGSVHYITYGMDLGWFLRGVHRHASYASVILGGLWLLRLVLGGVYRAPREVQWWLGLAAVLLILVLGVTGNILPWDQRGYWAAVVETTIAGGTPVVGQAVKRLIVGGPDFGHQTLTRIYALHALVLPFLLVVIGWAHARLFARNGFHGREGAGATEPFWPGQAFRHLAAALAAFGVVAALSIARHGYSLDAPADPASDDYPARPEWYFLALYQLLKVFQGREFIATQVIPGAVVTGLFLLPLLDRFLPRKFAQIVACTLILTVFGCAGFLTYQALAKDARSESFRVARTKADVVAGRAHVLAGLDGVPPGGSGYLMMLDPLSRGGDLFGKKCEGCHNLGGEKRGEQWAPNLGHYGSHGWIRGLLDKPGSPDYFGKAPMCGGMAEWKEGSELSDKELDDVAAYVASFALVEADATPAAWADDPKVKAHPGRPLFEKECAECHSLRGVAAKRGPDLFAYGSNRWVARMIREPGAAHLYGYLKEEQKMPAFGGQLTDSDVSMLVRYLGGDYRKSPVAPETPEPPTAPATPGVGAGAPVP